MSNLIRQNYHGSSRLRSISTAESGLKKAGHELEKIAGEIAWYEEQAGKIARLALQYKLEIGKRLARAKELLPHGQFLSWAQREFGWTPRHVQNHLLLAENAKSVSHLPPESSLRMALASIKKSDSIQASGAPKVEVLPPVQRIHLIGEIEEGSLNQEHFIREVARIAAELGAPKTKWRAR